jgi:hypothetical protein
MARSAHEPASKPRSSSASSFFTATADASTGKVHIDSVSDGAVVHASTATAKTGFTCIVQTKRGHKVVGYQPLTIFSEGHSYEDDWLLSPYSVKHARVLGGKNTFQVEMCMTGSGHTSNSYHQWFNGGAIVLQYTVAHKLGQKWGTKVVSGGSSATLNFQLSKGAVTIGGSTQVKNYGTHAGDTGHEANLTVPGKWNKFDVNRVNTFYVSSHDFIFQGTASDEGNVGHALYEFDTGGTVNFRYGAATDIRAFCAKPMGLPCAKFS